MSSASINDFYNIGQGQDEIELKVTIRKVQISKSTVRLNKQLVGEYDDSFKVKLGKAKDLVGSILYVESTETDVDPNSNDTSFTLFLSGGPLDYKNQRVQTVRPGGYVFYTAEIVFLP